jgi:hypothetical protein
LYSVGIKQESVQTRVYETELVIRKLRLRLIMEDFQVVWHFVVWAENDVGHFNGVKFQEYLYGQKVNIK